MAQNISRNMPALLSGANPLMVAALAAATIVLVAGAVIGARNASDGREAARIADTDDDRSSDDFSGIGDLELDDETVTDEEGAAEEPGATGAPSQGADPGQAAEPGAPAPGTPGGGEAVSQPGATRTGIHADHFEWGVHAPVTLNGAPLSVAEDPITGLKGYVTWVNNNGGVNGRKVRMFLEDDKYTTDGGKEARDRLVNSVKPFFIAGTLGVDQINVVATAAGKAGIPYMAVGGPEPEWKTKGMYQVGSSYDQYMELLVEFLCSQHGKDYVGEEIRIGTTTLNTNFILPVEKRFIQKLTERGCVSTPVDSNARTTVRKPDQEADYTGRIAQWANAYDGQGANLMVPLQDPITTARQVAQLKQFPAYNPLWTFNNFAHDSDTVLDLMAGEWTGVRALSAGCYYLSENAYNPALCARMKDAHDHWVSLGHVRYDENAGGNAGGKSEYTYDERSWETDGQGGSSGYQLVHFWLGAMKQIGADPTREKFVAALNGYQNYSDVLSAPITFAGSDNIMRGAYGGVVYEGQSNREYRQVNEITPGIVDHF